MDTPIAEEPVWTEKFYIHTRADGKDDYLGPHDTYEEALVEARDRYTDDPYVQLFTIEKFFIKTQYVEDFKRDLAFRLGARND